MKRSMRLVFFTLAILMASASCGGAATSVPPADIASPSPVPPTRTPEPTATATQVPSPTPLPGSLVLPLDTLGNSNPWLPLENSAIPGTNYFYFNLSKPPFNSVLVRQAFAAAIDREALVKIAEKYGPQNSRPATTLTPPETLGRDLYNEVGISFDPVHAQELLAEAGYTDAGKFPPVTVLINLSGDAAPGFHVKVTNEMVKMWEQHLGIKVTVEVIEWGPYLDRIASDPPELFRLSWGADYNDPDSFLRAIFESGAEYNHGNFSNPEFDALVNRAKDSQDPAERQELYIQAERILCETEAVVIPIFHSTYQKP